MVVTRSRWSCARRSFTSAARSSCRCRSVASAVSRACLSPRPARRLPISAVTATAIPAPAAAHSAVVAGLVVISRLRASAWVTGREAVTAAGQASGAGAARASAPAPLSGPAPRSSSRRERRSSGRSSRVPPSWWPRPAHWSPGRCLTVRPVGVAVAVSDGLAVGVSLRSAVTASLTVTIRVGCGADEPPGVHPTAVPPPGGDSNSRSDPGDRLPAQLSIKVSLPVPLST
jgi:hypothetical protein